MERPVSVTVFGILNIVFAVLKILGILASLVVLAVSVPGRPANPAFPAMFDNPAYLAWMKISIPWSLLVSAILLAAGIGLLYLKPWARRLSLGYGIYAIVACIVAPILTYYFVLGPMLEQMRLARGPESALAVIMAVVAMASGVLGLIYPVLLLFFLTRPHVIAAFRAPDEVVEAQIYAD